MRYLQYLQRCSLPNGKRPSMPPDPIATRWSGWFSAVQYHAKYFAIYRQWVEEEMAVVGKSATNSLLQINGLLSDGSCCASLAAQLKFVDEMCASIIHYLEYFESQKSYTLFSFENLEELQIFLETHSVLSQETSSRFVDNTDLIADAKQNLLLILEGAMTVSADKLIKYLRDDKQGQPAIHFLRECRIFNPSRVSVLPHCLTEYSAISGFVETVPQDEFILYINVLAPEAIRATVPPDMLDIDLFWCGIQDGLPR
jgi:hypothetical protein